MHAENRHWQAASADDGMRHIDRSDTEGGATDCAHREILNTLPPEHPDRNRPLAGAYYRMHGTKVWREIKPSFRVASGTYNDLGAVWTAYADFGYFAE